MQYFDARILATEPLYSIIDTTPAKKIKRIKLLVGKSELSSATPAIKKKLTPFGVKYTISASIGNKKPTYIVQFSCVVIARQKKAGFCFSTQGAQVWLSTYAIERMTDMVENAANQGLIQTRNIVIFPELASFLVIFTDIKTGVVSRFETIRNYQDYAQLLDVLICAVYDLVLKKEHIKNHIELLHASSISTWAMPLLTQLRGESRSSYCIMVDPPALRRTTVRTVLSFLRSGIGNMAASDTREIRHIAQQKVRNTTDTIGTASLGKYETPAFKKQELTHTTAAERLAYRVGIGDFFISIFRDGLIRKFVRLLTSVTNPSYSALLANTRCIVEFAADSRLTEFFVSGRVRRAFWQNIVQKNTSSEQKK